LKLEQLQRWKRMWSGKLSSNLQPGIASTSKELKYLVILKSNTSVSKQESFKQTHWVSFRRASDYGWGRISALWVPNTK